MLALMSSDKSSSNPPDTDDMSRLSGELKSASRSAQPSKTASPRNALVSGLYVVSTPIGNLRDITLRAIDTLQAADEILAEDTRVARRLLDTYDIRTKVSPYHDHNGAKRRPEIMDKLANGEIIALISDAGTPLVSDPGWKLARTALDEGHRVFPIPGASALLSGLVASGLPSDKFMFCGFLPAKTTARKREAKALAEVPATLVFYESGPRLAASLTDLAESLGPDREAAVARELTKLFEETRRATLGELAAHYTENGHPKGEIVVLIGPPLARETTEADIDAALIAALADLPLKQAANKVAEALGIPKRDAYQRGLALKDA
jgi:16S rRNA (cytidine1402-2'-O)-methyltransferase